MTKEYLIGELDEGETLEAGMILPEAVYIEKQESWWSILTSPVCQKFINF
jgi:hypothetical protein